MTKKVFACACAEVTKRKSISEVTATRKKNKKAYKGREKKEILIFESKRESTVGFHKGA